MAKRKTFERGEAVEVRLAVSAEREPATYEGRLSYVSRWHEVYINSNPYSVAGIRISPARRTAK